jgi:hypothetical protein
VGAWQMSPGRTRSFATSTDLPAVSDVARHYAGDNASWHEEAPAKRPWVDVVEPVVR